MIGNDNNMFNATGITDMFSGVIGKIAPGKCRLSFNGQIAVKTSDGYKTYNPKTGNVTNCSNFVLDIADDMFMVIPTRKLRAGDIVIINGKPRYVLEVKSANRVEVMNYEDSSIQTLIPERHALMGRKFYGKVVSLIGNGFGSKSKGGFFKNMLKLKMMGSFMGNKTADSSNGNALAMMMMMGMGSMDGLFDGVFNDGEEDDSEEPSGLSLFDTDDDDEEQEEETTPVTRKTKKTK